MGERENPHPPGTTLAAHWELRESFRQLGAAVAQTKLMRLLMKITGRRPRPWVNDQ